MLTTAELARYSRHLLLPEVGQDGQERLKRTSVLVVGAGGLGSPLLMYLTAAGLGRIGIVDFDIVDASNLQRQVLFDEEDVGRKKVDAAVRRLRRLNSTVRFESYDTRLTSGNALEIIGEYDIVADGTDNFATRYLVNDACILSGKPNVYASIYRFEGQLSVFGAPDGPCYRCLYPVPPPPGMIPSCAEGGVLGILPGILGSLQAAEVIKMAAGIGDQMTGRLLLVDVAAMSFKTLKVDRNTDCPICGAHPTQTSLIDYDAFCGTGSVGAAPTSERRSPIPELTVFELQERKERKSDTLILDVRTATEFELTNIGGMLVPLAELPGRLDDLAEYRDREIVVVCRSGARSARAVSVMIEAGFSRAFNLRGGLLAWSQEIDSSIPRY